MQAFVNLKKTNPSNSVIVPFIKRNSNNIVGAEAFANEFNSLSDNEIDDIMKNSDDYLKNYKQVTLYLMGREIQRKMKAEQEDRSKLIGTQFVDFELTTQMGEKKKLSDYVGKSEYILIDFWASWCGPCIAAMPKMKTLYEHYKPKGIEFIGISIDK